MIEIFETIKEELMVMLVAAMPLSELRGAIPLGITMGFTPWESTVLSIIGNIIPVPFLLKLLEPIMNYLENTKLFSKTIQWVKRRTLKRSRDKIKKYSIFGLFILVAIPLPTTGAWTGCIAATLLKIDFKNALTSIISGVIAAGIIVYTLSSNIIAVF
ncbi:COG2426 family protein [Anaerosalibacter sp. Marseille-P3206]|uniref:COG2426 family protein n=1 Tax=Anaerosalibacter sp. Marseille-P3206 TaxID=1871005 RepID=UPI0009874C00|nr:small multi-drug export protein [Anaerosalibacter sp. Marseille-P3206]